MRSMAQLGAMVFGVVFLLLGIAGLFVPSGMAMDADLETTGMLLGLFPVNLLHNAVHILFGAWGLFASRTHDGARTYGRIGAAIYVVLAVLALVSPSGFGLVPIGGHDIWLHVVLALGLAYIGFAAGPAKDTVAAT